MVIKCKLDMNKIKVTQYLNPAKQIFQRKSQAKTAQLQHPFIRKRIIQQVRSNDNMVK